MTKNSFTFTSSNKIDTIHAREWIPDSKPKAIIQLAHGMQEYMKNYERFAEFLCGRGYYVIGHDCIGHGDTARKGELGHFTDRDSSEFLLLDMRKITELSRGRFSGLPHIMYGHSFGSFLTRIYISRYRDIDGAILMGSGDLDLKHVRRLLRIISFQLRRKDCLYRSKLLAVAAFGKKLRKFLPLKNSFEWTTRDNEKVMEYLKDSKNNYLFTLHGFSTLFLTVNKAQEESVIENTEKNTRILLISGDNDAIGDFGKGVKRVYNDMISKGLKNVTIKLFPDARHNLLQETCYKEVHSYISDWCDNI